MTSVALDNDVVFKGCCFRLGQALWPEVSALGVLGAAPFVLRRAIERGNLVGDKAEHLQALEEFLAGAQELEPSGEETELAAGLEFLAEDRNVKLDVGEAQLAAMCALRQIDALHTGDKRAIAALEEMLDIEPRLVELAGRVHCLEQLIAVLIARGDYGPARSGICAEPQLDSALRICFSCTSGNDPGAEAVMEALASYAKSVRSEAPRLLSAT